MTINDIEAALASKISDLKNAYGADVTLSASDNTQATDDLAEVLETLNPNNNYPPVVKS